MIGVMMMIMVMIDEYGVVCCYDDDRWFVDDYGDDRCYGDDYGDG